MPEGMPKSVVWYERIAYAGVALSAVMLALTWSNTAHYLRKSPILYPLAIIVLFAVEIFWIRLVARKRQNWARWASAAAVLLGFPGLISNFEARYQIDRLATVIYSSIFMLFGVAVAMLFMPDARAWFRNPQAKSES